MVVLSEHFKENWRARVGNEAHPQVVERIMRDGVIVQYPRQVRTPEGVPFVVLAIYWDPELDIVVKVDPYQEQVRAVSVLVGNGKNYRNRGYGS